jgi:thiol-disulfide isomerase/thioredoxin
MTSHRSRTVNSNPRGRPLSPAARARLDSSRKRRNRRRGALAATVVVIVAALALIIGKVASGSGTAPVAAIAPTLAPQSIVNELASVPVSSLATAAGSVPSATAVAPQPISGLPVKVDGKPEVLYVGAEYCPYCAATRWAMVVALSKFGTFTNLGATHSSSTDVYPNTPTFSFYGATYHSKYLSLVTVEETTNQRQGNGYVPLQSPTAAETKLIDTYDPSGTIPFVDFGGKSVLTESPYNPGVLAGSNMATIASEVKDPSTAIGKAVQGSAGKMVASLCQLTGGQPGNVCQAVSKQSA